MGFFGTTEQGTELDLMFVKTGHVILNVPFGTAVCVEYFFRYLDSFIAAGSVVIDAKGVFLDVISCIHSCDLLRLKFGGRVQISEIRGTSPGSKATSGSYWIPFCRSRKGRGYSMGLNRWPEKGRKKLRVPILFLLIYGEAIYVSSAFNACQAIDILLAMGKTKAADKTDSA
jgi:hypothetical protein